MEDVLVVYVIDKSGSMGGLEQATCDGLNGFVKEQANLDGNAYISIILFDNQIEVPFTAWNVKDLPLMTTDPGSKFHYFVRGSTALRDAVGTAILGADAWLASNKWFDGKVVVSVITDGMENASTQFSGPALKALIEEHEAKGFTFTFDGAGESWLQGSGWGIRADTVYAYTATPQATSASYFTNSVGVSALRSSGSYSRGQNADTISTSFVDLPENENQLKSNNSK